MTVIWWRQRTIKVLSQHAEGKCCSLVPNQPGHQQQVGFGSSSCYANDGKTRFRAVQFFNFLKLGGLRVRCWYQLFNSVFLLWLGLNGKGTTVIGQQRVENIIKCPWSKVLMLTGTWAIHSQKIVFWFVFFTIKLRMDVFENSNLTFLFASAGSSQYIDSIPKETSTGSSQPLRWSNLIERAASFICC